MEINKNTQEIYDWIELRDFDELNDSEKQHVKNTLGTSEYQKMRETFLALKNDSDAEMLPQDLVLPTKQKSILKQFFQLKMPVYQAAAIVAFVVLFSGFIQTKRTKSIDVKTGYDYSAEYSKSIKEDSLAAIFITGMYR